MGAKKRPSSSHSFLLGWVGESSQSRHLLNIFVIYVISISFRNAKWPLSTSSRLFAVAEEEEEQLNLDFTRNHFSHYLNLQEKFDEKLITDKEYLWPISLTLCHNPTLSLRITCTEQVLKEKPPRRIRVFQKSLLAVQRRIPRRPLDHSHFRCHYRN